MEQCLGDYQGDKMYPEDLFDPGTYVDTATGDIWEKRSDETWTVNGMPHKPFPHSLVPEPDTMVESHSEFRSNPMNRELRDKEGYCE
jgi:hypothetical protein